MRDGGLDRRCVAVGVRCCWGGLRNGPLRRARRAFLGERDAKAKPQKQTGFEGGDRQGYSVWAATAFFESLLPEVNWGSTQLSLKRIRSHWASCFNGANRKEFLAFFCAIGWRPCCSKSEAPGPDATSTFSSNDLPHQGTEGQGRGRSAPQRAAGKRRGSKEDQGRKVAENKEGRMKGRRKARKERKGG